MTSLLISYSIIQSGRIDPKAKEVSLKSLVEKLAKLENEKQISKILSITGISLIDQRDIIQKSFGAGLNYSQIKELFKEIIDLWKPYGDFSLSYSSFYEIISEALKALIKAKAPPKETYNLFKGIIYLVKKNNEIISSHIRLFLKTIPSALEAQLSQKEILHILDNVSVGNLDALPLVLISASNAKLSPKEITFLIINFSNKTKYLIGGMLLDLPKAIDVMAKNNLTPSHIVYLIGKIADGKDYRIARTFEILPATLDALSKSNLGERESVDLLAKIAECCKNNIDLAYSALPSALDAKLSSKDIVYLFGEISKNTGNKYSTDAFDVLPHALNAKLSSQEIINLFRNIPIKVWAGDDINYSPSEVFKALPKAFESAINANIPPSDVSTLFKEILNKAKWKSAKYFKLLPEIIAKAKSENKISNKEIIEMLVSEN